MPKVEIGKDGSQVIRIHQSQITADQLKSLQVSISNSIQFETIIRLLSTLSSVRGPCYFWIRQIHVQQNIVNRTFIVMSNTISTNLSLYSPCYAEAV